MKKLVGLLLAGLAMISMTFMSCSADTESPSAPAFEVTYGDRKSELDEITVDLTKSMPNIYLFSKYYDKLEVVDAFIEETDDVLDFEQGRASSANKNVQLKIEDFLAYVSEPGEYTIVLIIVCDGVIKEEYELAINVVVTNGNEPIVYTPVITTNLPAEAEVGDTLSVVASVKDGSVKYQWYKDTNVITGATEASYKVTEKGSYNVRVSNAADSSKYVDSSSTRVVDPENPDVIEITKEPTSLVIANLSTNSSQLLYASAKTTDGEKISAQWFKDGVSVSGVHNGTGSLESTCKPSSFGTYVCKFTSGEETITTNTANVTEAPISQGLVIDGIIEGVSVNVNDTITIAPRSDVPCTYTYQWWVHGETSGGNWEIAGATDATYTVTEDFYNDEDLQYGIYCVVTFKSTQTGKEFPKTSVSASFKKPQSGDPVVPTFKTNLTDDTKDRYVGDSVELTVEATVTDGGVVSYQWYKNGAEIAGATSASYTIDTSKADTDDKGNVYTVKAINTLNGKTTEKAAGISTIVKVKEKLDDYGRLEGGDESKDIPGFDFN